MKKILLAFALVFALFSTSGCNHNQAKVKNKSHKKSYNHIPRKSKFARLRKGMGKNQVIRLIGHPTDRSSFMTGKRFIPFYYGPDRYRTVFYYRRHGELQFNSRGSLVAIKYNRNEDGYR